MHIHILGICDKIMAGIAHLAKEAGHRVTGCDYVVDATTGHSLEQAEIAVVDGFSPKQIEQINPDLWVIGGSITNDNPLFGEILCRELDFVSGVQWLADHILKDRQVIVVAGRNQRSEIASRLAWILKDDGLNPGFLLSDYPEWNPLNVTLGDTKAPFVIEAEEYEIARFDRRPYCVLYRPFLLVISDHEEVDYYPDFYDLNDPPLISSYAKRLCWIGNRVVSGGGIFLNDLDGGLRDFIADWSRVPVVSVERDDARLPLEGDNLRMYRSSFDKARHLEWDSLEENLTQSTSLEVEVAKQFGVSRHSANRSLQRLKDLVPSYKLLARENGNELFLSDATHPQQIEKVLKKASSKGVAVYALLDLRRASMAMVSMNDVDALVGALLGARKVCFVESGRFDAALLSALWDCGVEAYCVKDEVGLVDEVATTLERGEELLAIGTQGLGRTFNKIFEKTLKHRNDLFDLF